jgi:elongation factor Ts
VIEKIVAGRLEKFYDEACLLRQPYIRDETRTVEELLREVIATTGENVAVRRFARWEVGEPVE